MALLLEEEINIKTFAEFNELSKQYNMIPIKEEIIADTRTPVSLYQQLAEENDYSYLLESASSGKRVNVGRYSFIGLRPEKIIKKRKEKIIIADSRDNIIEEVQSKSLIEYLNEFLNKYDVYQMDDLPPFSGGLVGYFGYEMVAEWENLFHRAKNRSLMKSSVPSSLLVVSRLVAAYDHLTKKVKIIDNIFLEPDLNDTEKNKLFQNSKKRIKKIVNQISTPRQNNYFFSQVRKTRTEQLCSNTQKDEFEAMVREAKNYIKQGEVFQVVLSQKFSVPTDQLPFSVYRALRVSNPSPYMFYLNYPEIKLIGSSPEILVQVKEDRVITRPLAGTRRRGDNNQEDKILEDELKNDEKEKAEHLMLVDLGRNDLGKVCKYGTVQVQELMGIEYYSRVMHLVSQVEGQKKDDFTSLDVLKAVFPAGTVSGAPKIRAMELIDNLEKESRGVYAGAVGYVDFRGNLDTCITIRSFEFRKGILSTQVGAGMVADSTPEREYQETLNKARALFEALEITRKEAPYGLNN